MIDKTYNLVKSWISDKHNQIAFLTSFVGGLVIHLYFFVNLLPNADCILATPYHQPGMWELSIGRWVLPAAEQINSRYSLPWITGVWCMFWLSLSCVIITRMFKITNNAIIMIYSISFVSFPSLTATFAYLFTADIYMMGIFFSILSVYLAQKQNFVFLLIGSIILALSMGIYQAYLVVAMVLCVSMLMFYILLEKTDKRSLIKLFLRYIFMGSVGVVLYFVILEFFLNYYQINLSSYRGINETGSFSSILLSLKSIPSTWKYFIDFLFTSSIWNWGEFFNFLYIILTALFVIGVLALSICSRSKFTISCTIFFFAIIPLIFSAMKLLAPSTSISPLMLTSYALFIPISLIFIYYSYIKFSFGKGINCLGVLVALLLSYRFILLDNISYLNLELQYEKTYGLLTRIAYHIEQIPEISSNNKLIVIGNIPSENYPSTVQNEKNELQGLELLQMDTVLYEDSRSFNSFFRDYLGITFEESSDEDKKIVMETKEFKNMPIYPQSGSVAIIDNYIVVKLSE